MSFTFDRSVPFPPLALYRTAIQLMYELANRRWADVVSTVFASEVSDSKVLILFVNPLDPAAPQQLQVMHCVAALYRAVVVMTDGVRFCRLKSYLTVFEVGIGAMSVAPLEAPPRELGNGSLSDKAAVVGSGDDRGLLGNGTSTTSGSLKADSGRVTDPDNPNFTLAYHFFGKPIPSKEVSMAILEAMTTAAPFGSEVECKELLAVSPNGGCSIVIESVGGARMLFTYRWATRALKVLYQEIVVPQRRWGDLMLVLMWKEERFGELRMLRAVRGSNGIGAVASER